MRKINHSLKASVAFAKAEESNAAGGESAPETNDAPAVTEGEPTTESGEPVVGAIQPLTDKAKVSAIRKALGADRVYLTATDEVKDDKGNVVTPARTAYENAEALLADAMGKTESFYGLPYYANSPDSAPLDKAETIVVATLGIRVSGANGYKAIIVTQQPSYEDFLANPDAKDFIKKLVEREAMDVAFSAGIRSAETYAALENAVSTMPITVDSIIVTQRESGGGLDTDTFDAIWGPFRTGFIKTKVPKLFDILPQKPIVLKALRSAAFAKAHPACESIEKAGMFKKMLEVMIQLCPGFKDSKGKDAPLDPAALQEWLDARDSLVITYTPEVITKVDDLSTIQF